MLKKRILLVALGLSSVAFADKDDGNYNFHAQATTVTQGHEPFASPYAGQNSLVNGEGSQTSLTATFFGGWKPFSDTEVYLNPELSGGSGMSHTQGIAGFPNGEIFRVDNPTPAWNVARFYVSQTWGFSRETEKREDGKNQIAGDVAVQRLTATVGKFALNDFFDNNSFAHDPRTQFLNWAFMDYGAWDYGADTRGYTWGLVLDLKMKDWSVRAARVLVPEEANGIHYDMNMQQAYSDNIEFEYRYLWTEQQGALRFLAYQNHAHMGSYSQTLQQNLTDITQTREYREKTGYGASWEQALGLWGFFSRLSWNDGRNETWAFTEIDQSASLGATYSSSSWWEGHGQTLGMGAIVNGLSEDHKKYLEAGGYGFIIGDGHLRYSPEKILEVYYLVQIKPEAAVTLDYQFVNSPAYNVDRGPVSVFAVRLHYER